MKKSLAAAVLLFAAASAIAQSAHYAHHGKAVLPDRRVTPGLADPALTKERLCASSFRTGTVRLVTEKQKRDVCAAYGQKDCPGAGFEIDHLISIELGGSNDSHNLWPQPVDVPGVIGYHTKDVVENRAHAEVCNGTLTLREAQIGISTDWYRFAQQNNLLDLK
jgi:hypothetical protein